MALFPKTKKKGFLCARHKIGISKYLLNEQINEIMVMVNVQFFFLQVCTWQSKFDCSTLDCSRKFKYLGTFDLDPAWFELEFNG